MAELKYPWEVGLLRVHMRFRQRDSSQSNVYHVANDFGSWTDVQAAEVQRLFHQWFTTATFAAPAPASFMSEDASFLGSVLKYIIAGPELKIAALMLSELGFLGLTGQPRMPAQVTAVVQWRTGLGYRATEGRTYPCGLTYNVVAAQSETHLEPSIVPSLALAYSSLPFHLREARVDIPGLSLVVFHRRGFLDPVTGLRYYTEIDHATCRRVLLGTQRGRLPGEVRH